ncbi:MAG: monothiol glutaredoxin [Hyphomonadaceae bacterium]|nr:MAG: monothiol glutaredoxin [Hyphomonadaceae bacterium]KAF0186846.1 MAG: monothiol glutaredoxin [Hyphomonadaceae bacterium]
MSEIQATIEKLVNSGDVVLFMKGDADQPQCGFSATVVRILDLIGVPFKDYNVLTNMEVREGIKEYSNWPTIPQLYVKGEFVGGCDIVREMYEAGELTELMQAKGLA